MSDENALLDAIIAHPDEDTPRLIYADWLDEHGEHDRAAFIRVQCRLADMSPGHPDWVELNEHQDELVARLKHRFSALIPKSPNRFYFGTDFINEHDEPFRRGFPHSISCQTSGAEWNPDEVKRVVTVLTGLVQTTTIRGFNPYLTPPESISELLAAPVIAELTSLAFSTQATNAELITVYRSLGTNESLHRLQQLGLYGYLPGEVLTALAKATTFHSLRKLTLQDINAPKAVIEKLTKAPWFRQLRHFRCFLEKPSIAVPMITGLGKLPELHTLDLPLFIPGAVAALAAGKFPSLARLLYNGPLTARYAKSLARAQFPKLAAFEASGGGAKTDGFAELLKAEWLGQLRVLDLSENAIGDRAIKALVAHPITKTLRILKLGDNPFGKTGLMALAMPSTFPALTTLNLSCVHTRKGTPTELAAFLSSLSIPHLRHLNLSGWPLGNAGAKALADNPAFAKLTRLDLSGCGIGDPGIQAIFASPHLQNLLELQMSYNNIRSGADAIADPTVMPRLGECWLSSNKIPKTTAEKLKRDGLFLIT